MFPRKKFQFLLWLTQTNISGSRPLPRIVWVIEIPCLPALYQKRSNVLCSLSKALNWKRETQSCNKLVYLFFVQWVIYIALFFYIEHLLVAIHIYMSYIYIYIYIYIYALNIIYIYKCIYMYVYIYTYE